MIRRLATWLHRIVDGRTVHDLTDGGVSFKALLFGPSPEPLPRRRPVKEEWEECRWCGTIVHGAHSCPDPRPVAIEGRRTA